jgi:putative PIN family toxin of toxin-antitoxin system
VRTIRVVLDTNVVVSAHLNGEGYERAVLDLALDRKLRLALSEAILAEYEDVLRRLELGLGPRQVSASLRLIRAEGQIITPLRELSIAGEPADNRFLECAEAARADFLVTGNKRHFPKRWRQTAVLNARELLEWVMPELER